MYEGQLYGLTRELLKDFDEYTSTRAFGLEFLSSELPQMRTIPVERSIKVEHQVATYDQLTSLIIRVRWSLCDPRMHMQEGFRLEGEPLSEDIET